MSIWVNHFTLEEINARGKGTLSEHLGIEFTEVGENYIVAKMPVDKRTFQPMQIMHGGASCVLAETVGSVAANFCVDLKYFYCVGLDINTTHIRMAKSGYVFGTARPIHIGKTIQVWEIKIVDEHQKLISNSRLTMMALPQKTDQ